MTSQVKIRKHQWYWVAFTGDIPWLAGGPHDSREDALLACRLYKDTHEKLMSHIKPNQWQVGRLPRPKRGQADMTEVRHLVQMEGIDD
jgi:hypothetical protein